MLSFNVKFKLIFSFLLQTFLGSLTFFGTFTVRVNMTRLGKGYYKTLIIDHKRLKDNDKDQMREGTTIESVTLPNVDFSLNFLLYLI